MNASKGEGRHRMKFTTQWLLRCSLGVTIVLGMVMTGPFQAGAITIGVLGGDGEIISAPGNMSEDAPGAENTHQQAFDELQNFVLQDDLVTDTGIIDQGTLVSSHMIFLNTAGNAYASDFNTWEFSGEILGLMGVTDSFGANIAASSNILGAQGTIYPGSFPLYGLEGGDQFSYSGRFFTLMTQVSEPGDWVRVVTAGSTVGTPEPASIILLGSGMIGLGVWRWRRGKRQQHTD